MFSIYPLWGTNKPSMMLCANILGDLSPTGDEQTSSPHTRNDQPPFIPYGGRTNFIIPIKIMDACIYPLRGTNEPLKSLQEGGIGYLSPTGDERTTGTSNFDLALKFIPYGGRTNESSSSSTQIKEIYPLRGTNEHDNLHRLSTRHIYPLRGTNKPLYSITNHSSKYLSPTGDERTASILG